MTPIDAVVPSRGSGCQDKLGAVAATAATAATATVVAAPVIALPANPPVDEPRRQQHQPA